MCLQAKGLLSSAVEGNPLKHWNTAFPGDSWPIVSAQQKWVALTQIFVNACVLAYSMSG